MVRSPSPLSEDEIRATFIRKRDRLRNRRRRQSFSESGPLSPRSFSLLDEDDEEEEEDETPTIVKTLDEIIPIPTRTIRMAEIEVEEEGIETIQYQDSNSSDENETKVAVTLDVEQSQASPPACQMGGTSTDGNESEQRSNWAERCDIRDRLKPWEAFFSYGEHGTMSAEYSSMQGLCHDCRRLDLYD